MAFPEFALVTKYRNSPPIETSSCFGWNTDHPSEHAPCFWGRPPVRGAGILTFYEVKHLLLVSLALLRKTGISRQIWKTQRTRQFLPPVLPRAWEDTLLGIELAHPASCSTSHLAALEPGPHVRSQQTAGFQLRGLCLLDVKMKWRGVRHQYRRSSPIVTPQRAPLPQSSPYVISGRINHCATRL